MAKSLTQEDFRKELLEYEKNGHQLLRPNDDWLLIRRLAAENIPEEAYWTVREKLRQRTGIYPLMEFDTPAYQTAWNNIPAALFVHPSLNKEQPSLVAYTKNHEGGRKDIQITTRIGKFLRANTDLHDDFINGMANEYTQIRKECLEGRGSGLFFADTPYDIVQAYYRCAVGSCMSYNANKWGLSLLPFGNDHLTEDQFNLLVDSCAKDPDYDSDDLPDLIHPVALYGLMDNIQCAYYMSNRRVVARTLINTSTKQFVRIYGNPHIKNLLSKRGYRHGHVLTDVEFPLVYVDSERNARNILAPYVDKIEHTAVRANVDLKRNIGWFTRSSSALLTFTYYQYGSLPVTRSRICCRCDRLYDISLKSFSFDDEVLYACDRCMPRFLTEQLDNFHIGFTIDYRGYPRLIMDKMENFSPYLYWDEEHTKSERVFDRYSYIENNGLSDLMKHFKRSYDFENQVLIAKYFRSNIHKSGLERLRTDPFTGIKHIPMHLKQAVLPNGEYVETACSVVRFYDYDKRKELVLIEDALINGDYEQFNPNKIVSLNIRNKPSNHLPIWTFKSQCVYAIIDAQGTKEWRPLHKCMFALQTNRWYSTENKYSFRCIEPTDKSTTAALKEHGTRILRASRLVERCYPIEFTAYKRKCEQNRRLYGEIATTKQKQKHLRDTLNNWRIWADEITPNNPLYDFYDFDGEANGNENQGTDNPSNDQAETSSSARAVWTDIVSNTSNESTTTW